MNYLQLSPKELIEFADEVKRTYNLVIVERPATVRLDENRYGGGWVAWEKTYVFSVINKEGEKEHITIQNGNGETIYAVDKRQYNGWKNWKIVSVPLGWSFGRILSCMAQLSHRYNLINPTPIFLEESF